MFPDQNYCLIAGEKKPCAYRVGLNILRHFFRFDLIAEKIEEALKESEENAVDKVTHNA